VRKRPAGFPKLIAVIAALTQLGSCLSARSS
jgi:hypothetical protein